MGYKVGTVLIDIKADTAKLVNGMEKAERTVKKSVDNIKRTLIALAATYASIESIKAFAHMANEAYEAADATGKLAQTLGMTAEQLSKLEYVAGYADVSINKLQAALAAMIRRTTNFVRSGGGAAANALRELGISAEYARTHFTDTATTFEIIIDRLRKMPDGFRKTAIAQDIFSKNAAEVLRISSMSKNELQKYYKEAEKFSIAVPNWVARMSGVFDDIKTHISAMTQGFKNKISYALLPAVLSFAQTVDKWLGNAFNRNEDFKELGTAAADFFTGAIRGAGFLKDAFNGVKLVLKTIEIAFYGLATVVAVGFEPIRVFLNSLIKINNALADSWLGAKMHITRINGYFASAVPDNIAKIKELKNEIVDLAHNLHTGRDEAEKLVKTFNKFYEENKKHKKDWNEVKINKSTGLSTDKVGNSALSDTIKKLNLLNNLQTLHNNLLQKQQNLLKQLHQQYTNLLPPKEQINEWYKNIVATINKVITDPKLKKQALELALKIKVKKEENISPKKEEKTYFEQAKEHMFADLVKIFGPKVGIIIGKEFVSFLKAANWNDLFSKSAKLITDLSQGKSFGVKIASGVGAFVLQHFQQSLSYLFDSVYHHIRNKYKGRIEDYTTISRNEALRAQAYSAFGYQGNGALASYQANVANVKALEETYKMDYALMKRAKINKAVTQHTMEAVSIAAGTAAAIWFDGGAVLQGLNMALNAQKWADQATGFKKFQQNFIEAKDRFLQAVRDLADNLIQLAGNVYKSIKDYRNIFDKITGSATYKVQNLKESLSFISKYSDLTTSSLANLTQNILKVSKSFVEGAVKSASDFKKLIGGEIFKKYGLSITALNERFKNSLNVIANLIDAQRKAKDAIKDYIAELKGSLGDTTYQKRYTQQQFALALKNYYAGKIDGSTLLSKAKAYQAAGGDASKIIKTLQGVETQSTKDYLKGILNAVTQFNAVGLPYSNIQALKSPEVQTLDVIKDTKNILQHIMDLLGAGFKGFGSLLSGILSGVNTIVKLLSNVLGAIIGGVTKIIGGITGAITNLSKTLVNALSNLGKFIGNLLGKIGNFALNLGGGILNVAGNLVGSALNAVSHLGSSVGHAVSSVGHSIRHIFHHFGFAEGGYTGSGLGYRDNTGQIVAGVVHAGEWVAPAWMVNSMPNVFSALEGLRVAHSANNSLFKPVVNVAIDLSLIRETNIILTQQVTIQKKMLRLLQKFDEEGIRCVS